MRALFHYALCFRLSIVIQSQGFIITYLHVLYFACVSEILDPQVLSYIESHADVTREQCQRMLREPQHHVVPRPGISIFNYAGCLS